MTIEETKRFIKEHAHNHVWFACSDDQYPAIRELIKEEYFKPLANIVGNHINARHWFVPCHIKRETLSDIFTYEFLNNLGIHEFNLDYSI